MMTGEQAVALIELEAAYAGVPLQGMGKRDLIVAALDRSPASIPHFLESARAQIEARVVS